MITYLKGDATQPVGQDNKYIIHVCNDIGAWGSGFVMALSNRWDKPEQRYRRWAAGKNQLIPFELGHIQLVRVTEDIEVINMLAQHETIKTNSHPLDYMALDKCLRSVYYLAKFGLDERSVHMPRIGCGLAGGSWDKVEPIIEKNLKDLNVFIYDL